MVQVVYRIVEHDDGWAYRFGETYSETFTSHDAARAAAIVAAREQMVPGENVGISFEDKNGKWLEELSDGHDRPSVKVEG